MDQINTTQDSALVIRIREEVRKYISVNDWEFSEGNESLTIYNKYFREKSSKIDPELFEDIDLKLWIPRPEKEATILKIEISGDNEESNFKNYLSSSLRNLFSQTEGINTNYEGKEVIMSIKIPAQGVFDLETDTIENVNKNEDSIVNNIQKLLKHFDLEKVHEWIDNELEAKTNEYKEKYIDALEDNTLSLYTVRVIKELKGRVDSNHWTTSKSTSQLKIINNDLHNKLSTIDENIAKGVKLQFFMKRPQNESANLILELDGDTQYKKIRDELAKSLRNKFDKKGNIELGYNKSTVVLKVKIKAIDIFSKEDNTKENIAKNENSIIDSVNEFISYIDYNKIYNWIENEVDEIVNKYSLSESNKKTYSMPDILKDVFISEEKIEDIISNLDYKKNIILQGAPGVGKTFVAKRLCYLHQGYNCDTRIEMVQFHQSYSYEDFIRGYRPNKDGGFLLKNGVFYEFVKKAQNDLDNNYYFIIDEINRGNLSKIFGELMMLIERDKRGSEYAVTLTYSEDEDEKFYLPENLYIIGSMNTADRSLAMVDYALRRRFAFIDIEPGFESESLKKHFNKYLGSQMTQKIISKISKLNKVIENESVNLGKGYRIGHSYFTPISEIDNVNKWYERIIKMEIEPLIREYWFDESEEDLRKKVDDLLGD